jgi:hypothetical protein
MPVTHQIIGTGITKRIRTSVSTPYGEEEIAALHCMLQSMAETSTFEGLVGPWEDYCRNVLAQAKLPPWDKDVRISADGGWRDDLPADWGDCAHEILGPEEGIGRATAVAELRFGLDSQEWFAADFLQDLDLVRRVIARGEAATAAHQALSLAIGMVIAKFKFTWEPAVEIGMKIQQAVHHGGKMTGQARRKEAQLRHAQWQQAADVIWTNNPDESKTNVSRAVARQFKVNEHTVRKNIRKPVQRGS